ncbi:MAG TPA: GAF domain-containing sensor histidine kinase [Longimicrobiales bacterium]|nr:GAF domain-containing sensor histidine kinase [Longimicrobiales bacterium]
MERPAGESLERVGSMGSGFGPGAGTGASVGRPVVGSGNEADPVPGDRPERLVRGEAAFDRLARLCVPRIADYCVVHVEAGAGRLAQLSVAVAEDRAGRSGERGAAVISGADPQALSRILATGKTERVPLRGSRPSGGEERGGAGEVLLVPLVAGDRVLGVLELGFLEPGRRIGEADVALVEELGRGAALVVEHERLLVVERRSRMRAEYAADRIARLNSVAAALAQALTPAEVAKVLTSMGVTALGAAAGLLAAEEPEQGYVVLDAVGFLADREVWGGEVGVGSSSPLGVAATAGAPVYLQSAEEWQARYPGFSPGRDREAHGAFAAVPLIVDGRAIGVVGLGFRAPHEFDEDERAFLQAVCRQFAYALDRARSFRAAQEASRARADFLAKVSHEFRTPLGAIIGYTELLDSGRAGYVNAQQREYLGRVAASAWHLSELIEGIQTFSRMEAKREVVRVEPLDLRQVLSEAVGMIQPFAASKSLVLEVEAPSEPVPIVSDRAKLRQIVVNLLSNAVKFTERGRVRLRGWVEDGMILVEVSDTGVGIASEDLEKIFEPFRQAQPPGAPPLAGTGLGLTVVRGLCRLLGGDVRVSSEPGVGSVFTVELPARAKVDDEDKPAEIGLEVVR